MTTGVWLAVTQGRAAGDTAVLTDRICSIAVLAAGALESFRELKGCTHRLCDFVNGYPYFIVKRQVFDVLSDVIKPV
jgi:hypothetical protein